MLDYQVAAENGSMYNTPPCWPIYICGLVFKHLIKLGGLEGEEQLALPEHARGNLHQQPLHNCRPLNCNGHNRCVEFLVMYTCSSAVSRLQYSNQFTATATAVATAVAEGLWAEH